MVKGSSSRAEIQGRVTKGVVSRAVRDVLSSRVEHKRITATNAYADFATAGAVASPLQAIGQGDDINGRSGDTILVEQMMIRAVFKNNPGSYAGVVVRFMVVSDTLNQGTAPAVTDILASADVNSGYNQTARQQNRFKILHDFRTSLVGQTNTQVVTHDRFLSLNRKVFYSAASGASSHGRNAIFVLFISDSASANVVQYKWSHDTQYTDS